MKALDENWLTHGLIDIEYKKYIMMSYIQHVQERFSDKKLYPVFHDLKNHYQNLVEFERERLVMEESFPKRITKLNLRKQQIKYSNVVSIEGWASELNEIVSIGLKLFGENIKIGTELIQEIVNAITILPIGVLPIYKNEGYLLISSESSATINVYKYSLSALTGLEESEQIRTSFITLKTRTILNTNEKIKSQIARADKNMPNPATYSIHCSDSIPLNEALLPVAKNLLKARIAA